MFVDESIPTNFNKIAEISDNYFVLVRESSLNSGTNYQAYYQFISPSTLVIYTDHYKIKQGDSIDLDVNYTNNQYYNYIDSIDYSFSVDTFAAVDIKNDFWSRADCFNILGTCVIIVCFILFMINAVTSLVEKGGVFHV